MANVKKKIENPEKKSIEKIEGFEVYNAVVTATLLNVRRKPDINSEIVTMLEKDTEISVIDHTGEWAELNNGGFVMRKFIMEI